MRSVRVVQEKEAVGNSLATHSGSVTDNDKEPDSVGLGPALYAWHSCRSAT